MVILGNKIRMTEEKKKCFISETGLPLPETVEQYNAAMDKTSEAWMKIGEQENSAEAKILAAVLKNQKIEAV